MNSLKNTGIEWIPHIKSDWEIGKVKDLFYVSKEFATKMNPTILSLARSAIRIRDISNNEGQLAASYDNYNTVQIGDLLLNPMDLYSGANCNVSYVEGVISPAYSNLRAKTRLEPRYFDFYFKFQYWTMAMFAHGKGVSFDNRWTLNNDALLNYEIPIPSYQEQKQIVAKLEYKIAQIDKLITNQEKQIEKLELHKKVVIRDSILFDLNGLSFDKIKFKYCATLANGKEIDTEGGEYPVYGSGGVFKYTNKALFEGVSLLMGRKGSIDNPILVNEAFWTVDTMFYTTEISDLVLPKFLYYAVKEGIDYTYFKSGSVLPSMTQTEINNILLPYPSIKEQMRIVTFLDEKCELLDRLFAIKRQKIDKLNEYKKSLIYEYVTGKKHIS